MASADRLIEVFNEAKARPVGAERDHFLSEICRDEPALKEQVLSLLQAHEGAGDFLKNTQAIPPVTVLTEKPGDKIGRYKLLQKIGEGGCGVVYMAEQEEPVRRRVAFKVIKLGMDTKQVVARFEAEGQALALMDHPNIAKVLDAGATDTGRPYFVMELVRGIKITEYCDQNNLPTEARLKLFTQVCNAIQHAHQKGIIHRDIKPSNILVTVNDGVPVPKVIDFGIAKAIEQRLTAKTVFTAFEQFIGTPAYMSPEQAEMTSLDIDTRADIYSLGVLLYELLSGNTPFDAEKLVASGVAEIRRIIREQEPPKPSTRLNTLNDADLSTVASRRQTDPPKLMHLIRGDLDWIVMKCLEKDRTRRYETANGLAMDLQRHLNNEPVVARPPTNLYRFQKLVRRNKLAVAAAGAVTAALIFGLGVSTWMFFKEKEARQRAVAAEQAQIRLREEADVEKNKSQTQAVKSQQVASFLESMLKGVGPTVAMGRDTTLLREILDKTAARIGRDLTNQPEVELELRITLFNAYAAIGAADKSEEMARSIVRLTQSFAVAESVRAEAWLRLGLILRSHGKLDEAERCGREALAAYRKVGGKRPGLTGALMLLSQIQNRRGSLIEGEALCREAVALTREMFGNEDVNTGNALTALADQLRDRRKLVEAESLAREALAILRKRLGRRDGPVIEALFALAGVLGDQGKWAEAEVLLRDELATRRLREHPDTIRLLNQLGQAVQKQGHLAESETMLRGAVASARNTWANNTSYYYYRQSFEYLLEVLTLEGKLAEVETIRRELLVTWAKEPDYLRQNLERLSAVLSSQGKSGEVESLLNELLVTQRKEYGEVHREVQMTLSSLGQVLQNQRKWQEAEAVFREALAMERKLSGDEHINNAWTLGCLAGTLQQQGKFLEAETAIRESLAIQRKVLGNEHPDVANTLHKLGDVLRDSGQWTEAEAAFREAVAMRRKLFGNEHPEVASTLAALAACLRDQAKLGDAETSIREALAIQRKRLGDGHPDVVGSVILLSGLLSEQDKLTELESLLQEQLRAGAFGTESAQSQLGHLLWQKGDLHLKRNDFTNAEQVYERALQTFKQLQTRYPENSYYRQEQGYSHRLLGYVLIASGRVDEAVRHYRAAIDLFAALAVDQPANMVYPRDRAYTTWSMAQGFERAGRPGAAAVEYRQAITLFEKSIVDFPNEAALRSLLAEVLRGQGKSAEAELVLREAMALRRKQLGNEHPELRHLFHALTEVLCDQGKLDEAEATVREELALTRKLGREHPDVPHALQHLADVLDREGNYAEVKTLYHEAAEHADAGTLNQMAWRLATAPDANLRDGPAAVSFAEKAVAATNRKNALLLDTLAAAYAEIGQFTNAVGVQQEAIALLQDETKKKDYSSRLELYSSGLPYRDHAALARRVSALLVQGKFAEAEPPARECLALREKQIPDDWLTFNARSMLGGSLLGQKKYADAESLLISGYEGMKHREDKIPAIGKLRVKETLQRLVQLYEATGQSEKTAEWSRKLAEFDKAEAEKKTAAPKP